MREAADTAPLPDVAYLGFGIQPGAADPLSPKDEVGIAIPATMAFLGLAFVCCVLLVAGLPPLSGFLAKFALLYTAIGQNPGVGTSWHTWAFCAVVLAISVTTTIACTRAGMRLFWSVRGRTTPRLRIIEAAPTAFLILLCVALTAAAGPVMTYLDSAARSLHSPEIYIRVVTGAQEATR